MDELRKIVIDYLIARDAGKCGSCGKGLKPSFAMDYGSDLESTYLAHRRCLTGSVKRRKEAALEMGRAKKSHREIAEALGVSLRTVYNYLKEG